MWSPADWKAFKAKYQWLLRWDLASALFPSAFSCIALGDVADPGKKRKKTKTTNSVIINADGVPVTGKMFSHYFLCTSAQMRKGVNTNLLKSKQMYFIKNGGATCWPLVWLLQPSACVKHQQSFLKGFKEGIIVIKAKCFLRCSK